MDSTDIRGKAQNLDGVVELYNNIKKARQVLLDAGLAETDTYSEISERYNELKAPLEKYIAKIEAGNANLAHQEAALKSATSLPDNLDEFRQFRQSIIEAVGSNELYKDGGADLEHIVDQALNTYPQYAKFLEAMFDESVYIAELQQKRKEIAEKLAPDIGADLFPNIADSRRAIGGYYSDIEEIQNKLSTLSDDEFDIAYDAALNQGASTWNEIIEAIAAYNREQEIAAIRSNQLKKTLSDLWVSEDFEDVREDIVEMAEAIDGISTENIKELCEDSAELSDFLNTTGMDAQFLAKILQTMAKEGADKGLSLITERALLLNEALNEMSDGFKRVTAEKARYDAAMAVDEKDDNFKSYSEAFAELNEQFKAGTVNSNAFWASAEFLFGEEQLAAWGWSDGLDNIYAAMKKNKLVFEDADSAGAGFVDRLYKMSKAGELLDETGKNLLEISQAKDGTFSLDVDADNIDEIAKKMGITEEAAIACLQALSMWGDINFYDIREVSDTIEKVGLSAKFAGQEAINIAGLTKQLVDLGKTRKEINDVLNRLSGLDGVTLFDVTDDVATLTQNLIDLGLAIDIGGNVSIGYENLGKMLVAIGTTKEEAQKLLTKLGQAGDVTLRDAGGDAKDISDALAYLDTLSFDSVEGNMSGLGEAAKTTSGDVKETRAEVAELDTQTLDNVIGEFDDLKTSVTETAEAINKVKRAVSTLDGANVEVSGGQGRPMPALADGTKGAPGGKSLVGEEGVELVQSGKHAYLVGTHGAEIVDLKRGDMVFNNQDTKRILKTAGGGVPTTMPSYLSGNVNTGQNKLGRLSKYLQYRFDNAGGSGSGGNPWADELKYYQHLRAMELVTDAEYYDKLNGFLSKYYGNREKYLDDYRGLLEEAFDLARTLADDWFNDMEHKLFLMERNDAAKQDQIDIYKQMQAEAHQLAQQAREQGLDENADFIQSLQKQWWDYQDAIEDLYADIYKAEQKARENTLRLLNNQYEMFDGYQDSDAIQSNLDGQLAAQKAIQESAFAELQRLRGLGVDENDDAVQDCLDAWWGAYDSIQSINSKIVDNVLGMYDDFIDRADDFDMWAGLDFTKVDYLKSKLAAINKLWEQGVLTLKEYNQLLRDVAVDIYQEQKDALVEIIELTMDLIKRETEDKMDALEAQIDAFQKIIDLKKKSLEVSREEENYQRGVANRVKKIAEIQAKLAQLERDTSASTNAEKAKLAEELAELQIELSDYQADYSYNSQVDALDREADAYESTKKDEIAILKDTVMTSEQLYNAAIARIDADWAQLYADLLEEQTTPFVQKCA